MNSDYLWIAFVNRDTGRLSGSRIPGYVIARPDNLFYLNSISLYIGRALEKCQLTSIPSKTQHRTSVQLSARDEDPVSRMSDVAQELAVRPRQGITLELDPSVWGTDFDNSFQEDYSK